MDGKGFRMQGEEDGGGEVDYLWQVINYES